MKTSKIRSNTEFKKAAKDHQIAFRSDPEIGVPAKSEDCPVNEANYPLLKNPRREDPIRVRSALLWGDAMDKNKNYRIFYSGFRGEITREINSLYAASKKENGNFMIGPMVTNLLRSEHIPYNVFFPIKKWDMAGAAQMFNELLEFKRIDKIIDILIEYNPKTLGDRTSFDVFIKYSTADNLTGGIGIEVKYTEKEYPLKKKNKDGKITKEYRDTHDELGNLHIAHGDNEYKTDYYSPCIFSGWFRKESFEDVAVAEIKNRIGRHVVCNDYRQIWRNHLLGASMILSDNQDTKLDEFFSLTVYPYGNGHFSAQRSKSGKTIWEEYAEMLTPAGQRTIRHTTYERLFPLMRKHLRSVPHIDQWIDYLEERYIIP